MNIQKIIKAIDIFSKENIPLVIIHQLIIFIKIAIVSVLTIQLMISCIGIESESMFDLFDTLITLVATIILMDFIPYNSGKSFKKLNDALTDRSDGNWLTECKAKLNKHDYAMLMIEINILNSYKNKRIANFRILEAVKLYIAIYNIKDLIK